MKILILCHVLFFAHLSAENLSLQKDFPIEKTDPLYTPSPIETPTSPLPEDHFQKSFRRMLISLVVLLVLIFVTFWTVRKLYRIREKQANNAKMIKLLEKRVISPKSVLYLIEVEGEKVLIAESQIEVRPLHALDLEKT